ncbi:DedA family protein [Hydrogenimonas urashimensis]|uniref:DedA family protein n=1 Tax=Hydrogenimonas urashimensis TaxID=2740515 RepID=UPI00191570A7|nr:DedA family protein [Hydrogenimonas urashimensis]
MMLQLFAFPIHLLLNHGYTALFIWSITEGEIGLMLAGWLASEHKVFTYSHIIPVAIAGAVIGDLSLFLFGRIFEKRALAWLEKSPGRKAKAQSWLRRWGSAVIVFERFVYGTHIPALLTIGMSGYPFLKFLFFDIIGIVMWAFAFVSIGYYFGDTAINLILLVQKNVMVVLFFILLFAMILYSQNEEETR